MEDYAKWKENRLKRWVEYKKRYNPELVDAVMKSVDAEEYYFYVAKCSATVEETLRWMRFRETRLIDIGDKIEPIAKKIGDMPKELQHEVAYGNVVVPRLRRLGGRGKWPDNSQEAHIERASRVLKLFEPKDRQILEYLERYVSETYREGQDLPEKKK